VPAQARRAPARGPAAGASVPGHNTGDGTPLSGRMNDLRTPVEQA
jgi:hypothetical protein